MSQLELFLKLLLQDFQTLLTDHLLSRILNDTSDREFTDQERRSVLIRNNHIFQHQVLRINYTTYDI